MAPVRVLLIEDNDEDARLTAALLRRGGLDVDLDTVDTVTQVRAALDQYEPDLVISDYNLPAFTAEEALRLLREYGSDAPFILVSGAVGDDKAVAMMKAGANDFILKDHLARLVPAAQRELRDAEDRRQRRHAEQALRDSEQRFRLLAEHSLDVIFRYRSRPDRVLDYISPAITALIGHQPAELYADPDLIFTIVDPDDRHILRTAWRRSQATPQIVHGRHRDGRDVWLELRTTVQDHPDDTTATVEGVFRNVTDQHLGDIERRRLDHQLRQTERLDSLGHLAGGVAHDFSNILAVITAYTTDIATQLGPTHHCYHDAQRVIHAADRAADLTRQLLLFSRLEPTRPETLDINQVVTDTADLLSRTIGADITLTCDLASLIPPVTIDRSKLEQVIVNLVVNARAAMPDGGHLTITTQTAAPPPDRPAPTVTMAVTDTGSGMPPHVANRAFEPFFTTKARGTGTGLGLATAYGTITEAGGTIHIDTTPGHGTTISVELPGAPTP